MRRRGYTPAAIRNFAEIIGVAKRENIIDISLLEHCVREDLNKISQRIMAVFDPIKLVIDNYPEDKVEELEAVNNPEDQAMGKRKVTFSKYLYVEKNDFMKEPSKDFYRLYVGNMVRLKYAYVVICESFVEDEQGNIKEIHCKYLPETLGGKNPEGKKIKASIHWLSVNDVAKVKVNLYDRLFNVEDPDKYPEGEDFTYNINKNSLIETDCFIERFPFFESNIIHYQFERIGYFCIDKYSNKNNIIFNRTVNLKDTWKK